MNKALTTRGPGSRAVKVKASTESSEATVSRGEAVGSSQALGIHYQSLDGLRAVGMIAMFFAHSEFRVFGGAYMALSVFFTLSGFLITSILLRRTERGGAMGFRKFWSQRYRRLLPASLLCLFGVVIFAATVADPAQAKEIPGQVAATAAQVVNWFFIYTEKSYMQLFAAPSPVQHFWSLAVEEQFYIFMPFVFWLMVRYTKTLKPIAACFGLGAIASAVWTVWLYRQGASLDRIYYGTDTRAAEILMGGFLAVVLYRFPLRLGEVGKRVMAVVGVVAFGITVWWWATANLSDLWVYQGGFLLVATVSCALIASLMSGGPVAWLMSWGFLPSMGRISYGLYLFQWPIMLWLTSDRTGLHGWPLFILQLAVIFAVAIASYHLLEKPIRMGIPAWPKGPARWAVAPAVAVLIVGLAFVVGHRNAGDPSSSFAFPISTVSPLDAEFDVLVVPDQQTAGFASALVERGNALGTFGVTVAEPFTCEGLAPSADGETCSNWIEEWPALLEEVDPDLVLFYVDDWDVAQIEKLSELSMANDPAAVTAWTSSTLDGGFDILTSTGATLMTAQLPLSSTGEVTDPDGPFNLAMDQLVQADSAIQRISTPPPPAGMARVGEPYEQFVTSHLEPRLALAAVERVSKGPRILIVGDSLAANIGWGFERWAKEHDAAIVWVGATVGCGILDEGEVGEAIGARTEGLFPGDCRDVHDGWVRQVSEFQPDLVIMLSSVWDLQDRQLADWPEPLAPGAPAFDDYLLREYREAVDVLSSGGAPVLWMSGPCSRSVSIGGAEGTSTGAFEVSRVHHLNDELIPQLMADRDQVRTFDIFPILCPDGTFTESIPGVDNFRPDGAHLTEEGATWFAENYAAEMIAAGMS